ncbi:MAG TPA: hypothetical protein VFO65_07635 [Acidimicrobiales bacterium]|nr:hypothetical protein [Acidimicrobiales bacterium]
MSKRQARQVLAAVVLGGALAVAAVPGLPAVGQISPPSVLAVEVTDQATLVARGAAVVVPVEVQCPSGATGFLNVQVTQRVGSRIATGTGGGEVACTGGEQVVPVLVTAYDMAFRRGPAVAEANLFTCWYFCGEVTDSEVIEIRR